MLGEWLDCFEHAADTVEEVLGGGSRVAKKLCAALHILEEVSL
jgi:hypothetical protein